MPVGTKTYNNEIQEEFVSIGVMHLLIAPFGTAFTTTSSGPTSRVNVSSPPSGWRHLGAVEEEVMGVNVSREKLDLKSGVNKITRKTWVIGTDGEITASLRDIRGSQLKYAMGNTQILHVYGTTFGTDASTVLSVTTDKVITVSGYPTSIVVGNVMLVSAVATLAAVYVDGVVSAVTSTGDGTDITFIDTLEVTPVVNDIAAKHFNTRNIVGTNENTEYALLCVSDLLDGQQILHHFSKVVPAGDWAEEIRPETPSTMPIQFTASGEEDEAIGGSILCKRYIVNSY